MVLLVDLTPLFSILVGLEHSKEVNHVKGYYFVQNFITSQTMLSGIVTTSKTVPITPTTLGIILMRIQKEKIVIMVYFWGRPLG